MPALRNSMPDSVLDPEPSARRYEDLTDAERASLTEKDLRLILYARVSDYYRAVGREDPEACAVDNARWRELYGDRAAAVA